MTIPKNLKRQRNLENRNSYQIVNTESNIDNPKFFSVDQMPLSKIFHCPNCNKEVTRDHEDLVDCLCELKVTKNRAE